MDLGLIALTAALWHALPHGDSAWDVLETIVPFAFTEPMNTGGTLTGVPLHVGSEASSWTQVTFRLGGADVTDPSSGGRPLLYPDLSIVDDLRMETAVSGLHTGAPGPLITIVPKAGGSRWERRVEVAASPAPLQADGSRATAAVARLHALGRTIASGGGPLSPRLRLFAAGAGTWSSHDERGEPFRLPGNALSLAAHPTLQLSPDRHASLTAWLQRTSTAFAGRALLRDRDAAAAQRYEGVAGAWQSGVRRTIEISGSFADTHVAPGGTTGARGTVERLVDDPIETLVDASAGGRSRGSLAATLTTSTPVRLSGGISVTRAAMHASPFGSGLIGETVNGIPARAWDYGFGGESHRSQTALALYASTKTPLAEALELDTGLRVERTGGRARGAASNIAWTSWEPRVALRYARNTWTGILSARRYHPSLTLSMLANGDPAAPAGRSFLWTDRNADGMVDPNELGALVSLAGPGSPSPGLSTIDPAVRRPHIDELQAGFDVRVRRGVSLYFSGISRRGGSLIARFNDGVPFEAYGVDYVFDPGLDLGGSEDDLMLPVYSRPPSTFGQDRFVLRNIPTVHSTYGGLYLAARVETSPRWDLLVSAAALHSYAPAAFRGHAPTENDELIVGESYSDPNANTFVEGRTLFDRGYGLKVAASYRAARRLTLSAAGRYADGQNFARLVVVPDLPQGADVVRAYANGKSKFTYTCTLDVRVQKVVTWRGRDVTLGLESYNITNLRNEVEEVTVTGPLWRTPTLTQPPRVIRLTAAVGF